VSGIVSDLPGELQDAVSLMVSELSTNALVHASSGFDVAVERSDESVLILISDQGDGTPLVRSPDPSEPHGRGLRIVETLSDDWGIMPSPGAGKTVWFRMSLHRATSGRPMSSAVADAGGPGDDRANQPTSSRSDSPAAAPNTGPMGEPTTHHQISRRCSRSHPHKPARRRNQVGTAV
jgi:hypothetical protein